MSKSVLSADTRHLYGVTVTASNDDSSRVVTFAEVGPPREALRAVCDRIDALDGRWYVECISTPDTIYCDLQGERYGRLYSERLQLSRIGRSDLLREPSAHELKARMRTGREWMPWRGQ